MPPAYQPLHPELYTLREDDLDPRFRAAWRVGTPDAWAAVAPGLHRGIHELRVFRREWCTRLLAEVDHIEDFHARHEIEPARPNSMNEHGLVLDQVGFAPALQELVTRFVRPLAAVLYPELGGATLDEHHGFVVDYARGRDEDLGFHVDDSEVTLNLCLGEDFAGSELYFRGPRCDLHRDTPARIDEAYTYEHEPGVAILHAGKHRHGVYPLDRGRRRNLIVWCRSSSLRAAAPARPTCLPWCGARRTPR